MTGSTEAAVARLAIVQAAAGAAQASVRDGVIEVNPYPAGTQAARVWKAAFERYLLLYSVPEAEASA